MLSVIIPSYNDGECVLSLLNQLGRKLSTKSEVYVIESGDDSYFQDARQVLDKVNLIKSGKGRSLQLNRGIRESSGSMLLFLHADSDISQMKISDIPSDGWGCYPIYFASHKWFMKYVGSVSRARAKVLGVVYGDQGMWASRRLLEQTGYFPNEKYEDMAISKRLRKLEKIQILPGRIVTSARRFEKHGLFFTHLVMSLIFWTYFFGLRSASEYFYSWIDRKKLKV